MNVETNNSKNTFSTVGSVLYFIVGYQIVLFLFGALFEFSQPTTYCLATLFLGLTSYPIFVRGTRNIWTKDRRNWDFRAWLPIILISSIFIFFGTALIFR